MKIKDTAQIVEGVKYETLKSIAEAYGLTLNLVYKRHQRGKRGDNLVPEKFRKGYVESEKPISKRLITVLGIPYQSVADACRKNRVCEETFYDRRRRGLSMEEALGLTAIIDKRSRHNSSDAGAKKSRKPNNTVPLTAFGITYESYEEISKSTGIPTYVLYQRVNDYGKTLEQAILMEGKSKKIVVGKMEFATQRSFGDFLGIKGDRIHALLKEYSAEELLNNRTIANRHTFEIDGQIYESKRDFAESHNLTLGKLNYRLKSVATLKEAVAVSSKDSFVDYVSQGKATLYVVEILGFEGKRNQEQPIYKVGFTRHPLKKRLQELPFPVKVILAHKDSEEFVKQAEKNIALYFENNRVDIFTAKDFDGFSEIYSFTADEINKLKFIVQFDQYELVKSHEDFGVNS